MTSSRAAGLVEAAERNNAVRQLNVIQGQYKVSNDERVMLSTILGSCVAACIWEPLGGVGGMNHFLVSGEKYNDKTPSLSYGVYAMELLINGLLKCGAQRSRLKAKLFGGAAMMKGLTDIGGQNAIFAKEFLQREGIECVSASLGGESERRIKFWPVTGRVRVLELTRTESANIEEKVETPEEPAGNDVELF